MLRCVFLLFILIGSSGPWALAERRVVDKVQVYHFVVRHWLNEYYPRYEGEQNCRYV